MLEKWKLAVEKWKLAVEKWKLAVEKWKLAVEKENRLVHFLRIVYSDKTSSFEKLLETDRSDQYTLEIYRSLQPFQRK